MKADNETTDQELCSKGGETMKVMTEWWGVYICATDEVELKLLEVLFERTGAKAESSYEDGDIELVHEDVAEHDLPSDVLACLVITR